ncbi:Inward rectifier k channel protein, partial [Globisporangium splendens]
MFTNSAVIRRIRGSYYLMFQVCERRKHQLVEAHVRLYAVRHEFDDDGNAESLFQCHQMRVQQPDDDTGAMLLMVLPQVVVHRIDPWSPLFPPECLPDDGHYPNVCPSFPDPSQRIIDMENGNRDGLGNGAQLPYKQPTRSQIINHLRNSELEVIAVLEGIDASTSNTMQARYSYTDEDVVWDMMFENCVSKTLDGVHINFNKFHLLRPVPEDVHRCTSESNGQGVRWQEALERDDPAHDGGGIRDREARGEDQAFLWCRRMVKLSKAMQHVDEETRTVARNARLDALEADNYGVDAEAGGDDANDDDMYIDEGDAPSGAGTPGKDKRAHKNRKLATKANAHWSAIVAIGSWFGRKAKKWKVKSLAQLVFEEHGAGDSFDPNVPNYITVAAAASTHPARRFCCVCGFFAAYSCTRCGSRYCRIKCGDQHKESGCLKFGL